MGHLAGDGVSGTASPWECACHYLYLDHRCITSRSVHAGMCSYVLWKNAEPRLHLLQKKHIFVAGGEGSARDWLACIFVLAFFLYILIRPHPCSVMLCVARPPTVLSSVSGRDEFISQQKWRR